MYPSNGSDPLSGIRKPKFTPNGFFYKKVESYFTMFLAQSH